ASAEALERAWGADDPRFGRSGDLRHTVQVALRQVYPWSGIRPAPTRARPVPPLDATILDADKAACGRHARPRGPVDLRQVNSGALTGATLARPPTGRPTGALGVTGPDTGLIWE